MQDEINKDTLKQQKSSTFSLWLSIIALVLSLIALVKGGPPGTPGASIKGAQGPPGISVTGLPGAPGVSITGPAGPKGDSVVGTPGKDGKDGKDGIITYIPMQLDSPPAPNAIKLIGTNDAPIQSILASNTVFLSRILCTTPGIASGIAVKSNGPGLIKVALYSNLVGSDNSSAPGKLLRANNENNPLYAGWTVTPIDDIHLDMHSYYWLSFICDSYAVGISSSTMGTAVQASIPHNGFVYPVAANSLGAIQAKLNVLIGIWEP